MAVNAGPHLDNQSECAGCGLWLDDQVLQRVGDDLFCSECVEKLDSSKTLAVRALADPCPKREGTSASHCDHQTSPQVHPMIAHTKTFRCCFCGRARSVKYEPMGGGQAYAHRTCDHGPFAPQTWVMN